MMSQNGEGITALHEVAIEQFSSKAGRILPLQKEQFKKVEAGTNGNECTLMHINTHTQKTKTVTNLRRHPHSTHGGTHRAIFLQHF
jgi:hypothetical protein